MNVDVFMSYARVDCEVADRVAVSLQEADIEVWWDALLVPGETFDERIQEVVAAAKVIVGILSPSSLSSDWVRWELSQAITNGLHVVPLLVDGACPEDLPPPLSLVHCLVLPDLAPARLRESAERIRQAVDAVGQRIARRGSRDRDARRRLAQAATETARRAREIKRKNRGLSVHLARADQEEAGYSASRGFAALLRERVLSLAITSPDSGKLYLLGCDPRGKLSVDESDFDGPTGVCVNGGSLTLASRMTLHTLENVLRPEQLYEGRFSHCFVARRSHFLGELAPHDLVTATDGRALFVSSRYSCVATASRVHSFEMVWKPSFVTEVVAEDRCHLNGLVLRNGELAYATAFGESNSIDGWRQAVRGGGVVLCVRSDEVICSGLTMPHSPRVHEGRLWLLNSGAGDLGIVRTAASGANAFEPVASLPGFSRGLAFDGDLAFVGLSRPRFESFEGLELQDRLGGEPEARTGIAVVDLRSRECVEWFWLEGEAREVYDVVTLRGVSCPTALPSDAEQASGLVTMESAPDEGSARSRAARSAG